MKTQDVESSERVDFDLSQMDSLENQCQCLELPDVLMVFPFLEMNMPNAVCPGPMRPEGQADYGEMSLQKKRWLYIALTCMHCKAF